MGKQSEKLVASALSSSRTHMPIDSNFIFARFSSKHKLFARLAIESSTFFAVQKGKLRTNPHLKFRAALFRFFARSLLF